MVFGTTYLTRSRVIVIKSVIKNKTDRAWVTVSGPVQFVQRCERGCWQLDDIAAR